jgi:hypothetical protein
MNNLKNELIKLAIQGRFNDCIKLFPKYNFEKNLFKEVYEHLSYEENNICGYGFASYLCLNKEFIYLHSDISVMFEIDMPYIIGAYQASLAHTFRRIELNPEKESLYCDIYCIDITPEGSLPDEEILEIAQTIISKWPHNETAQRIIDTYKNDPAPQMSVAEKITQAISLDKKAAFKDLIMRGRYIETRQILPMLSDDEIEQLIFEIAKRERNICAYDYVWFLMRECGEKAQLHSLLSIICRLIFDNQMGAKYKKNLHAKELSFFHTYRAAELEPENIELQEKLLSLYEPGNESFDVEETKQLADRVLAAKPESFEGLRVLKNLTTA